jgi:hypothetical protein
LNNPSQACLAVKTSLLNPYYNTQVTTQVIAAWRKTCRTETARASVHQWLSGYAGESRPPAVMCGQQKLAGRWRDLHPSERVSSILNLHRRLLRLR